MSRGFCSALALVLLVAGACNRGPGDPPGLEGAGPLVAEFARAARGLDGIAAPLATRPSGDKPPAAAVGPVTDVAEAARAVVQAAEPVGDAGAAALSAAVADAANDVVRHLVTAAGGRAEGSGRMVLGPPAMVAFAIDARDSAPDPSQDGPAGRSRTELDEVEARERLQGDLQGEIVRFVYVALLAHPGTRAALAPRLSPDDLPAEVPRDRNLPVASSEEWQAQLFDDQNRLVVPSFRSIRWRSFIGWVQAVNPTLWAAVDDLTSPAVARVE
jgi:hypothetical protein